MNSLLDLQKLVITDGERAESEALQKEALNDSNLREQAQAKHEQYRNMLAARMVEVTSISKEDALERIPRYCDAEIEKKTVQLPPDHPLQIKGIWITAGELAARATEFDGLAMPDPIEGAEYGTSTAKFFANDRGSKVIHSWAHGVSTSFLVTEFPLSADELAKPVKVEPPPDTPVAHPTARRNLSAPLDMDGFPHLQGTGDNRRPKATYENFRHLLAGYGITAAYDVIGKELQLNIPGMRGTVDNWLASAITRIESLAVLNGLRTTNSAKYLSLIADEQQFNPIANWIQCKSWDGNDRLPAFYATLTARDDYSESLKVALIYRWLLSAVAAALKPSGFHCRGVLTLQGGQGLGKTTWILNLVNDPYLREVYVAAGHHLDPSIKDTVLIAIKHWIVELGELDSSFKKDIARIKGVITNKADKVRKPYAAAASEFQRRTVFAASVNEEHFLVDPTGNSRWWVIPLVKIDYQHGIDMQQVFAQLALDYKAGEQWWLTREEEELLKSHNRWHEAVSVIEELLLQALDKDLPEDEWPRLTASDVMRHLGYSKPTNPQARECGTILRSHFGPPTKSHGIHKWQIPLRLDLLKVRDAI